MLDPTWPCLTKIRSLFSTEDAYSDNRYLRVWWMITLWSVIAVLDVALSISLGIAIEQEICETFGEQTGYEVEFEIFGGCYAQTENGVFHTDQIRFNGGN